MAPGIDGDLDPDPIQRLFNDSRSTEPRALLTQLIIMSALSVRVFPPKLQSGSA